MAHAKTQSTPSEESFLRLAYFASLREPSLFYLPNLPNLRITFWNQPPGHGVK